MTSLVGTLRSLGIYERMIKLVPFSLDSGGLMRVRSGELGFEYQLGDIFSDEDVCLVKAAAVQH